MKQPIIERLLPVPKESGFRQDGYFVWGGSIIKNDDQYHMFASRWPCGTGFPDGYRSHSEIVRATADNPIGPYIFQNVVLSGRGGEYWDGKMCHNPKIVKAGDCFVLYYIGSAHGSKLRKIGYAWSPSVEGQWTRLEQPLPLGEDTNNPAPFVHEDGTVLIVYRDIHLRMHVARANSFYGMYTIVSRDIFPKGALEDPDLFFMNSYYHMAVEDAQGILTGSIKHGGHLVSTDGVHWKKHDPVKIYTHTIEFDDGSSFTAERRERPELFNDNAKVKGNGEPTHLVTSVLYEGKAWCIIQPIAPS